MKTKIVRVIGVLLIVGMLFLNVSCTQSTVEATDEISKDNMMNFIETIASVDNARIAGFEGESNTAELIESHFKELGLESEIEEFPIKAYALLDHSLTILSDDNRVLENVNPLSYSIWTSDDGVDAEVVSVGKGAAEDYNLKDVEGKIVLIQRGGEYFFVKTNRAYSKGAIGAIFYDPDGADISATLTKLSDIPAVSIQAVDAIEIEEKLISGESVQVNLMIDATCEDGTSQNVIGIYRSSNNPNNERVIVGAHYDGVNTPAANDNASGTSVVLELARLLKAREINLPFDVYFIAFGAEEIGLIGSDHYARNMTSTEKINTLFMMNFDMVGVGDYIDVSTVGDYRAMSLVDKSVDIFEELGFNASISEFSNSDHASFARVGIKSIFIQVTPDHNYHTDRDTMDKIQPEMLEIMCEYALKMLDEFQP